MHWQQRECDGCDTGSSRRRRLSPRLSLCWSFMLATCPPSEGFGGGILGRTEGGSSLLRSPTASSAHASRYGGLPTATGRGDVESGSRSREQDVRRGLRRDRAAQSRSRLSMNTPDGTEPFFAAAHSDSAAASAAGAEVVSASIESVAAALEGGQWKPAATPGSPQQQRHQSTADSQRKRLAGGDEEAGSIPRGKENGGEVVGGGGEGGGGKIRKPNALPLKERRSKTRKESPEAKMLQDELARQLKADSASGTLSKFNEAMEEGINLRSNLLSGVLNQCAKSGWMDDCMRVLSEMKARGMVVEENTFVPLIRGLVSRGSCGGALDLIRDMVNQGVQPRLRCYEPVLAGMCAQGDMDGAREVWKHMEQQAVIPREQQYVDFLSGLGLARELWENARTSKLDDLLSGMSYHARNLTMEQVVELETRFNAVPGGESVIAQGGDYDGVDAEAIVSAAASEPPLACRVKIESTHRVNGDDSSRRGWSDALKQEPVCCPACGGKLKAVGLTDDERARIRKTLFGLAGLQVKKHSRNKWTKMVQRNKKFDASDHSYFSFTDQDQREQLQIFVDWLHSQRAAGETYTAVIDSANVAYHKGNPWHFSLPQVDLVVQALEARGERPLVVIAEKYIDRVEDFDELGPVPQGKFKYMASALNKAIVKRWRAKSQIYECSDEASDDWYWMYAAVAFDDIPMKVISNDRTRDHRMSLAEPVPFLRWRTTQLAKFELSWGLKNLMSKRESHEGVNAQGWPRKPPTVAIEAPPAFTRDIQKSDQGCWHLPAGAGNDWLCVDIPRGLRLGLDKLPVPRNRNRGSGAIVARASAAEGEKIMTAEDSAGGEGNREEGDMIREVGGLLQSMRVKKATNRGFRYSTQGTVEAAAKLAKLKAAEAVDVATDATSSSKEGRLNSIAHGVTDIVAGGSTEGANSVGEDHLNRNREGCSEALVRVSVTGVPCEDSALAGAGAGAGESRDWASMTVHALKEELRTRGLKVSGRKAELVERLLRE